MPPASPEAKDARTGHICCVFASRPETRDGSDVKKRRPVWRKPTAAGFSSPGSVTKMYLNKLWNHLNQPRAFVQENNRTRAA
jgi:hypothetical protein